MRQFDISQTLLSFIDHLPWPLSVGLILICLPLLWMLGKSVARAWNWIKAWQLVRKIGPSISLEQAKATTESYYPRFHFLDQGESISLISWFVKGLFPSSDVNKFIVLGENGIGKTTFLLRLFLTYRARWWKRSFRIKYLSCSMMGWQEDIAAIPHPERTILLLDGIDECEDAYPSYRAHLDEIFTMTSSFAKLVLSCRKGYLPENLQGDKAANNIHYIGDRCYETLFLIHISAQKASLPISYHEINTLVHQEIGACTPSEQVATKLFDALVQIAQLAYENYQENHSNLLNPEDVHTYWAEEESTEDLLKRCLLIDKVGDEYRFHHQNYLAYFLAWQGFYEESALDETSFADFPVAQYMYQELCWERCVMDSELAEEASSMRESEYYRLFGQLGKKPLSTLSPRDVLDISRLYLYPTRHKDIRFLRNLIKLQSIHLLDCKPEELPAGFIEELPNSDILLHFYPKDLPAQVLAFQEQEAMLWLDEDSAIPIRARSLEPHTMSTKADFYSQIQFPGNRRPSSNRLLSLFDTHLQEATLRGQVNDFMIPTEDADGYELGLGLTEMDVFDRIRVVDFADQTRNVMFYNEMTPTLLAHSLKQICKQLFQILGEDDRNQEGFNEEDEAQVEDGYWLGRSWLWKNSIAYPHAAHLFMEQSGKVELCIWGIEIEPHDSKDPSEKSSSPQRRNQDHVIQESY